MEIGREMAGQPPYLQPLLKSAEILRGLIIRGNISQHAGGEYAKNDPA